MNSGFLALREILQYTLEESLKVCLILAMMAQALASPVVTVALAMYVLIESIFKSFELPTCSSKSPDGQLMNSMIQMNMSSVFLLMGYTFASGESDTLSITAMKRSVLRSCEHVLASSR